MISSWTSWQLFPGSDFLELNGINVEILEIFVVIGVIDVELLVLRRGYMELCGVKFEGVTWK